MSRFAQIDAWVFDLDNTLYPADLTVYDAIGARMTAFIARATGLNEPAALDLREAYFHRYGATVVGLVRHHGVRAEDFLDFVHDVDLGEIGAAPALARRIARLPGRKFVFTNGARSYARRVLSRLHLLDSFERIVAIEDVDLTPKPQIAAFERLCALCAIDPTRAALFEDHEGNLDAAATLGFATILVSPNPAKAHELDAAASAPPRGRDVTATTIADALDGVLARL